VLTFNGSARLMAMSRISGEEQRFTRRDM